ncbi:MAG: tetratricopeptide repeat protein, partial [Gammaproteobacteria bacterium]
MEQIKKGLRAVGVALALPLATALWSPLAAAEPAPAVRISNTLDAGQTARHDLPELRAGRYILTLSDSDLDLKLSVQRNAQPPVHYNSNLKRDEAEVLALNLNDGDVLQVTIAAEDNSAATAAYALSIRPALEDEHHVWPALASATEATNTATATADKADHLRSALRQLEQTDLDAHRARVAFALATHYYWEDFDVPRAIETASAAVAHYAKTDQPALHANARQLLAASIIEAANSKPTADTRGGLSGEAQALYDDALQHFEQAQNAHSALGNAYDVAMIENNIGLTHHYMGDLSYASRHYQIAADAMRELGETVGELNPRANLAVVDFEQGRLIPAREAFSRTLDLIQQKDEPEFYADTLNNLGAVNLELARYTEALDNFIAARDQHEHNDDQKGRARSVAGIGTTYAALGRTALAIDFLNQALTERTRLGDARGELSVRMHLGRLHNIAGQHQQALSQHKAAMPLAQRPMDRARLLAALARSQLETEDAITAKDSANQAIVAAQKNETVLTLGNAQRYLARAHLALDDIDAARRSIDQSLATLGQSRSPLNHALSLSVQAQVFAARNNWDAAKTSIEASLATIESIRARVDSPMLRAEYFAASQALYDQGIALFMRAAKHQDADERTVWSTQALLLSDRSKARILQDRIAQAWEQTPQSEAVHAQRRNLYAQLATAHGQAKAGQSDTTLTSLELQVRQLETTLRNTNAIAPSTQTLNLEQLAQFQAQLPTGT